MEAIWFNLGACRFRIMEWGAIGQSACLYLIGTFAVWRRRAHFSDIVRTGEYSEKHLGDLKGHMLTVTLSNCDQGIDLRALLGRYAGTRR